MYDSMHVTMFGLKLYGSDWGKKAKVWQFQDYIWYLKGWLEYVLGLGQNLTLLMAFFSHYGTYEHVFLKSWSRASVWLSISKDHVHTCRSEGNISDVGLDLEKDIPCHRVIWEVLSTFTITKLGDQKKPYWYTLQISLKSVLKKFICAENSVQIAYQIVVHCRPP